MSTSSHKHKLALFLLLSLLLVTSLLLIAASRKIASNTIGNSSNASELSPQLPEGMTCTNYDSYLRSNEETIERLRTELGCPPFSSTNSQYDSQACSDLWMIWYRHNAIRSFAEKMCNSCPQATPTVTPTPAIPWSTVTPTPTSGIPWVSVTPTPTAAVSWVSVTPTPTPFYGRFPTKQPVTLE